MTATAKAAGVDTWSLCWYVEPKSIAYDALEALAIQPAARGRLVPEDVAGHRVGWFPSAGLCFAEGHPSPDGLAPADVLPEAFSRVVSGMADLGIHVTPSQSRHRHGQERPDPGFAGIRRLDLTADLSFDRPADGLATLAGVASLPLPRVQTGTRRQVGGRALETVYMYGRGGKRVLGRWYDKGVESGTAARGTLIRPEDQRRFAKDARLTLEALQGDMLKGLFHQRFYPLWKATEGVVVASLDRLGERLRQLQIDGHVSPAQAKAIAGSLILERADANMQSPAQRYRDRKLARDHGLVLAETQDEEVEVDLHEVLEAALSADDWYRQG